MVKRGTEVKKTHKRLKEEKRSLHLFLFSAWISLIIVFFIVSLGISIENRKSEVGVASCTEIEKIVSKICYRQNVTLKGEIYGPRMIREMFRGFIADIDKSFWNCTGTKRISATRGPALYGNKVVENKTRLQWNELRAFNKTHVRLKGVAYNLSDITNLTSSVHVYKVWNSPILEISKTDKWDCLTKQVTPVVQDHWMSINDEEKVIAMDIENESVKKTRRTRSAGTNRKYIVTKHNWNNADLTDPIQKSYWPKGLKPHVLILGVFKNKPKPAYEELDWVTCENRVMPIEMCENSKNCPYLTKNKFLSPRPEYQFWYNIDLHCKAEYGKTTAWICYLNSDSKWDNNIFERYGIDIINLWHSWMSYQDPTNDMVKAESQRTTWSINDTLWKNGVGGSRLHPLTLSYAPRPGLSLELANASGIMDYILNNITDQQYRSAIVLYCMQIDPALRVTHTNQGIWSNHSDAINKGTLRWIGLSNFQYRVWDVFPVAMGLDDVTSQTITWRSFNHLNSEDVFPIRVYYRNNKSDQGLNKVVLAHGYWSTKYYLPMLKPSEHRGSRGVDYKVLIASPDFDIKKSSPFSRHSLRPEKAGKDKNKIRSCIWNYGVGKFEFRRNEEVKYLWFPAKEQTCDPGMFDSWTVKTPGTVFNPNRTWLHNEEHLFCTFKDLMRIGQTVYGSEVSWNDICSITSAAPLMLIARNQIMKKCAFSSLVNNQQELGGFFSVVDDYLEGLSLGGSFLFSMDFASQLVRPNSGNLFTVYWKVQKKAILWVLDNVKELAVSVWDLLVQSWYYIKIIIICLAALFVITAIMVMIIKFSKLGLWDRKALLSLNDSESEVEA